MAASASLPYLYTAILESLRLHPPEALATPRVVDRPDVVVCSQLIPLGVRTLLPVIPLPSSLSSNLHWNEKEMTPFPTSSQDLNRHPPKSANRQSYHFVEPDSTTSNAGSRMHIPNSPQIRIICLSPFMLGLGVVLAKGKTIFPLSRILSLSGIPQMRQGS